LIASKIFVHPSFLDCARKQLLLIAIECDAKAYKKTKDVCKLRKIFVKSTQNDGRYYSFGRPIIDNNIMERDFSEVTTHTLKRE
jgi:hypothetical protein